jgi:O-antigen ligase
MLVQAGRIKIRAVAAVLLLALITLTAAFYRDFSYVALPVGSVNIYITELVLAILLGAVVAMAIPVKAIHLRIGIGGIPAALFILWGIYCLYRGRDSGVISVREFATNYYALFYLIIPILFLSPRSMRWLAAGIVVGTAIAAAVVVGRICFGVGTVTSTGAVRYHPSIGVGASFTLFWFLGAPAASKRRRLIYGLCALASVMLIVVVTQHRSAVIALACALALWLLVLNRGRGRGAIGSRAATIALLVAAVLVVAIDWQTAIATLGRIRAIQGGAEEFNAVWRLYVWSLLVGGFLDSPLVGHGFGANLPAFLFRGVRYGFDPSVPVGAHNSYLFVLFKEGIVGAGLLLAYIVAVSRLVLSRIITRKERDETWIAGAAMGGFVFVALFAAFNVVLEGPYMGMFFWVYPALAEGVLRTAASRGVAVSS